MWMSAIEGPAQPVDARPLPFWPASRAALSRSAVIFPLPLYGLPSVTFSIFEAERAVINPDQLLDELSGGFDNFFRCMPIPMKSPGHSEMMPPMDSDMMSPRARASLAAEL
jgi:hypothetical protein